ncbi:MAG: plastocyanin/azurin family copper-binding protein [Bacteroidota bacterium]
MKNKFLSILFLFAVLITINVSCSKDDSSPTPSGGGTPPPGGSGGKTVNITDFAFSASLTVAAGTTVTWTNKGATTHTVTSDDGTSFDSGNIPPSGTYSHKFDAAGSFPYHCELHGSMQSSVTVTP